MSKIKVNNILPLPNTDLKIWTGGVTTLGSEADPEVKITLKTSTGQVGIGTTDPGALLEVRGPAEEGAASAGVLRLSTAETTVVDADQLGRIEFIAPLEASGTDAILIGASIYAESDDTFAADNNETELVFATAASDNATEKMRLTSAGELGIGTSSPNCMLHVAGAAAFSGPNETFVTFADGDGSPSVATGNIFKHHASTQAITTFDDGVCGQIITVISTAAITYNYSGSNLKCGSANIVTANGDVTMWVFDGTNWYLLSWMDVSANLSSGGF